MSLSLTLKLSSLDHRDLSMSALFVSRNFNALDDSCLGAIVSALRGLRRVNNGGMNVVDRIRKLGRHVGARVRMQEVSDSEDRVGIIGALWTNVKVGGAGIFSTLSDADAYVVICFYDLVGGGER